jgi:GAF domain-containing protein
MATGVSGRLAEEQTALRRVATLVARAAPPADVFAAVVAEAGRLLGADAALLSRYDPDDVATIVAAWTSTRPDGPAPVGGRHRLGGRDLHTLVSRTGRPTRIDDYADASAAVADIASEAGVHSAVGVPIIVEGRMWGVMAAMSTQEGPLPADTEARLAGFAELVATALANAQARVELRRFAEEQTALRRVATLVARGAPPEEVFAAVAEEVGRLLATDLTTVGRYDPGGVVSILGAWSSTGAALPFSIGTRTSLGGQNLSTLVFRTRRPTRIDDYGDATGPASEVGREWAFRAGLGAPISIEGRLWGVMSVASTHEGPLPADTEARLAGFTELVATTIADAQARLELRGAAEEQAALRRVATLMAHGAPPEVVFAAVAEEVGRLLKVDFAHVSRYDPDGAATALGVWSSTDAAGPVPGETHWSLGGWNVTTLVFQTGRPARIDHYGEASGAGADVGREWGFRSAVGVPISVEGRLWGFILVAYRRPEPLPADTEARLAGFAELVATALANAAAQAALTASRARIVAAADTARRRMERDLHDGAQQRLVSLALHLSSTLLAAVPPEAHELKAQLDGVAAELGGVLDELRELARGLHPAALAEGGLRPALKALGRRSAVPVRLDVRIDGRLPEPIELAAYYVVAEALTNTAKHADATLIDVHAAADAGVLRVGVRDDGRGGADPNGGSGLVGLTDRVEALGGRLSLHSPPGAGTTVEIILPLAPDRARPPSAEHRPAG